VKTENPKINNFAGNYYAFMMDISQSMKRTKCFICMVIIVIY